jgi:lipopolysaccharide/colanic/teichoic acid biosynthesis glycosyltransferase
MLARNWFLDRAVVLLDEREHPAPPTWTADLRKVGYDVAEVVRCKSTLALSHAELGRLVAQTNARCIIVPSPRYFGSTLDPIITFARRHGLTVRIFSPEVQRVLSTAKVDDAAGVTVEAPVRRPVIALQQIAKRAFDISAASLLLLLTSPVLLLVSLAIKLESKGPVLFRQPRSSSPGQRECLVFKFRSMHVDASEEGRRKLDAANESSGALFKIRNDPRVTQVGRVIRKLSIDELPQLLNVLRGDMSLVGPRPLPNDDFLKVVGSEIDACYHRRSWVKPGLTGLWQISGRSELGFMEMVLLDLYYAEHETIFLDLWIILNTIPVVLLGRGAY